MKAIPLTVIGGFLGAGKTTLLNRLLRDERGRRLAVLVNDFGSVSIDAELVHARDGDTIALANGCICCGVAGEFVFALAGLRDREDPPEHVVVEASGVADPATIANYGDLPGYARDACIVVADAETVRARADDHRFGSQIRAQLRAAHLIVVNKADLVTADDLSRLQSWLQETAPHAGLVDAVHGDVPADVLLGARGPSGREPDGHVHADLASWSWSGAGALHGYGFVDALKALPAGVLRAKGILHLREDPEHRYVLQLAGRRFSIRRDQPWGDDTPGSRVVVIGVPGAVRGEELEATMAALR